MSSMAMKNAYEVKTDAEIEKCRYSEKAYEQKDCFTDQYQRSFHEKHFFFVSFSQL
jgi:hypothetical protein